MNEIGTASLTGQATSGPMPLRHDIPRSTSAAMQDAATKAPVRMTELQREGAELSTQVEVLHKCLSMLEERLAPVMRLSEPTDSGAEAREELNSDIGRFLSEKRYEVRRATHRITRFIDCLEV